MRKNYSAGSTTIVETVLPRDVCAEAAERRERREDVPAVSESQSESILGGGESVVDADLNFSESTSSASVLTDRMQNLNLEDELQGNQEAREETGTAPSSSDSTGKRGFAAVVKGIAAGNIEVAEDVEFIDETEPAQASEWNNKLELLKEINQADSVALAGTGVAIASGRCKGIKVHLKAPPPKSGDYYAQGDSGATSHTPVQMAAPYANQRETAQRPTGPTREPTRPTRERPTDSPQQPAVPVQQLPQEEQNSASPQTDSQTARPAGQNDFVFRVPYLPFLRISQSDLIKFLGTSMLGGGAILFGWMMKWFNKK